ncbi:MAG TPA: beta-ketoacyl-ACP synthase I [Polyangiaceae bacterium]|jgi:3-oxoacyl-[acyl-carrier-protein] synthase-1|nr:beta-ketoacyl-ACP synthase I [Polyangiaceae bacterium]
MRRVVVTGVGILSCIGQNKAEVINALRQGKSGIRFNPEYKEHGLRCNVSGSIDIDFKPLIDKKDLRFMGRAAALTHVAMVEALEDSGLGRDQISDPRIGAILGAGGTWSKDIVESNEILRTKGVKRIGPYKVTSTMGNSVSACLSTAFGIRGVNYTISSACSTSAHCIGTAWEQIRWGNQDVVFAGGGEGEHYTMSCLFDAMGAFSTKFNDTPERASRPYDVDRDGFVIAEGAGVVVLEEYERAKKRGAQIYGEITGYGATSDGHDMVAPSGEGAVRAMKLAMQGLEGPVDYINTHGTSTPVGDVQELQAIREVFGGEVPALGSTKSLAGHSLGATGAQEAIFSLLMMKEKFLAASANIENLDPRAEGFPILRQLREDLPMRTMMSNSFGFGGTNATLVMRRV